MALDTRYKGMSIYRMSDPQANLEQTDPSQPDYVKGKEGLQEVRPVYVNGEELLNNKPESGPINFVAGRNVHLAKDGNNLVISASGSGGGTGGDEVAEGDGIDITLNSLGQKVISLEPGAISDEHIGSISISKLVSDDNATIIFNGGNANG